MTSVAQTYPQLAIQLAVETGGRGGSTLATRPRSMDALLASRLEQRVEARRRIATLLLLRQCDRPLGEALEDQVVEPTVFGQFHGGLDAIARVAGPGANPEGRRHWCAVTSG